MKKAILLFVSIILLSCSKSANEEAPPTIVGKWHQYATFESERNGYSLAGECTKQTYVIIDENLKTSGFNFTTDVSGCKSTQQTQVTITQISSTKFMLSERVMITLEDSKTFRITFTDNDLDYIIFKKN